MLQFTSLCWNKILWYILFFSWVHIEVFVYWPWNIIMWNEVQVSGCYLHNPCPRQGWILHSPKQSLFTFLLLIKKSLFPLEDICQYKMLLLSRPSPIYSAQWLWMLVYSSYQPPESQGLRQFLPLLHPKSLSIWSDLQWSTALVMQTRVSTSSATMHKI